MKNSVRWLMSRYEYTEERISELKGMSFENIQPEKQKQKTHQHTGQ